MVRYLNKEIIDSDMLKEKKNENKEIRRNIRKEIIILSFIKCLIKCLLIEPLKYKYANKQMFNREIENQYWADLSITSIELIKNNPK